MKNFIKKCLYTVLTASAILIISSSDPLLSLSKTDAINDINDIITALDDTINLADPCEKEIARLLSLGAAALTDSGNPTDVSVDVEAVIGDAQSVAY